MPKWVKGQSGNPAGRQYGTRTRITEAFLRDLEDLWRRRGPEALEAALRESPVRFCQMVAALLPRELKVQADQSLESLSDEELLAIIRNGRSGEGAAEPEAGPAELPSVH